MAKLISNKNLGVGEEAPKIEFPCDYPIKVLGRASHEFADLVISAVQKHAPDLDTDAVIVKESSKGSFYSVTVIVRASGKAQIDNIFTELKTISAVKIVL